MTWIPLIAAAAWVTVLLLSVLGDARSAKLHQAYRRVKLARQLASARTAISTRQRP